MDKEQSAIILAFTAVIFDGVMVGYSLYPYFNEVPQEAMNVDPSWPGMDYDCSCTKSCYCNFHKATYVWEGD